MKKLITNTAVAAVVLTLILLSANTIYAQNPGKEKKPIPQEVLNIAKKSCDKCHAEPAKGLPISLLNLSKWDILAEKKQASKSMSICKEVSKSKMPPKKYLVKNPDAVLSKEEIQVLCDWSASLQPVKR